MAMANGHKHLYEFGCFALDVSNRLLLRDGEAVPLQPKAFDTLVLLIERRGEVVTKDELLRHLWPNSFVEESNVAQNVYVLRKILSQTLGGDELIKTVPKRGYRFAGDVREIVDDAELVVEEHTWTRVVTEEELTLKALRRWNGRPVVVWHRVTVAALALSVIATVGGFMLWRASSRNQSAKKPDAHLAAFQAMRLQRLTDLGKVLHPAISPDGKYLAYVLRSEPNTDSIWIKHIQSGSAKEIVRQTGEIESYEAPIFSPDSSFVYFIGREQGVNKLFRVAILGDTPRKLIDDVWGRIAVSPDGQHVAFVRVKWNAGEHTLFVANADGTSEQPLATRKTPEYFNVFGIGPAWSPDGKTIALSGGNRQHSNQDDLVLIDVQNGSQRQLADGTWQSIGQIAWLPDGEGLLVPAKEKAGAPQQIWYVSYANGEVRRVTNDLNDYEMLSVTADGKLLVAEQAEQVSNLWMLNGDAISAGNNHAAFDANRAVQISSAVGRREGFYGIAWTPDMRIVYSSNAGGLYDLWIVQRDGSGPQRLTESTGDANIFPAVSPDGRYIVFSSDRTGENNIWRVDADGRNPVQLTHGTKEYHSSFSADGQWVFYDSGQNSEVRKVPITGGESVLVIAGHSSGTPVISPDGKLVAYTYYDEHLKDPWRLGVMQLDGSTIVQTLPLPFRCFRWTSGAQALTYIVGINTVSNLWSQRLDGEPPIQLTNFKDKRIYWFDWSPDGKYLAVARGQWSSDVVAISGFN